MGVARSGILRGPATIFMGGQAIYTVGGIKCSFGTKTFPIASDAYGNTGARLDDFVVELTFTPVGKWTTALLAVLYPWTNPTAGTTMFTGSDVPVTIHPVNGSEKIVFTAGAVTKMPGLILSAVKTMHKEMEITCLIGTGLDRSNAAALYTLTDSASYTDTSFAISDIPTVPYSASLAAASSPWDAILTEAGFEVDFNLQTSPVNVDTIGMVDISLEGLDIDVKLKPIGMTVAQVLTQLKVQDTGVKRGMDVSASAANLVVTGGSGNPIVTINSVRLADANQFYGQKALRHESIMFKATRPTGTGAMFSCAIA